MWLWSAQPYSLFALVTQIALELLLGDALTLLPLAWKAAQPGSWAWTCILTASNVLCDLGWLSQPL